MIPSLSAVLRQRLEDVDGITLKDILNADPQLRVLSSRVRRMIPIAAGKLAPPDVANLAAQLSRGLVRYLTGQYQYLDIERAPIPLPDLYHEFLARFVAAGDSTSAEAALGVHHDRLRSWVTERLEAAGALELVKREGFQPVCAEYSPQLQLRILGLELHQIRPPVLDIGCGDGRLVEHLRSHGLEATGIDRNASGGLLVGDWFDAPLETSRWGTIIAHQSVSLHFWQAHLNSGARAAEYARFFLRIVRALSDGGTIAYAPSVPFFENLFRDSYRVRPACSLAGIPSTQITRV